MSYGEPRFEELAGLWQEGQRRLREAEPPERTALERVVDALVVELHHRLGGPFTVNEPVIAFVQGSLGSGGAIADGVLGSGFLRRFSVAFDFDGRAL